MSKTLNFIVTFWGKQYVDAFLDFLLPTLLASDNIPAISRTEGVDGRIYVCTNDKEWQQLQDSPLFPALNDHVDIEYIDIGALPEGRPPSLHMSLGHRLAMTKVIQNKQYVCMLSPDALLGNGAIKTLLRHMANGAECVLFPALRFDHDDCLAELKSRKLLGLSGPIDISASELARIGSKTIHSWMRTFEFHAPYFTSLPIMTWFRTLSGGLIIHHASWGIGAADLGQLTSDQLEILRTDTIDGHFIDRYFFDPENGKYPVLLNNSLEFFMLPMTSEEDMPCLSQIEGGDYYNASEDAKQISLQKAVNISSFLYCEYADSFKRWAYRRPTIMEFEDSEPLSTAFLDECLEPIRHALGEKSEQNATHIHAFLATDTDYALSCRVSLPSLFSAGNILCFTRDSKLTIYGNDLICQKIQSEFIYWRLKGMLSIEFVRCEDLSPKRIEEFKSAALEMARQEKTDIFWLKPGHLYSTDVVASLARQLNQGYARVDIVSLPIKVDTIWALASRAREMGSLWFTKEQMIGFLLDKPHSNFKRTIWNDPTYSSEFQTATFVDDGSIALITINTTTLMERPSNGSDAKKETCLETRYSDFLVLDVLDDSPFGVKFKVKGHSGIDAWIEDSLQLAAFIEELDETSVLLETRLQNIFTIPRRETAETSISIEKANDVSARLISRDAQELERAQLELKRKKRRQFFNLKILFDPIGPHPALIVYRPIYVTLWLTHFLLRAFRDVLVPNLEHESLRQYFSRVTSFGFHDPKALWKRFLNRITHRAAGL